MLVELSQKLDLAFSIPENRAPVTCLRKDVYFRAFFLSLPGTDDTNELRLLESAFTSLSNRSNRHQLSRTETYFLGILFSSSFLNKHRCTLRKSGSVACGG